MMRHLVPPPDTESDPEAMEMLRAWIIDGRLQVVLAAWVWKDEPKIWGRLLADTAGHLADAISSQTGQKRDTVYSAIRSQLIVDLDDPDEGLFGSFQQDPN